MGMIDRYKKKGGFVQLVNLIETTGTDKREKFLKMIADENPTWEAAIKQKMLTMDRMSTWNQSFLMEFMPQIPAMAVACAIYNLSDEKKAYFLAALPFAERKKVDDLIKEHKPNSGEVASSVVKIINEVRGMVATNKLKFEKFDEGLVIPENFEEQLASGAVDFPSTPSAGGGEPVDASATVAAATAGASNASEELTMLRKKLVSLTQETNFLKKENKELKEKIDGIKEALKKIA